MAKTAIVHSIVYEQLSLSLRNLLHCIKQITHFQSDLVKTVHKTDH
jgi:hypothetical protein